VRTIKNDSGIVFNSLKSILKKYEDKLHIITDTSEAYNIYAGYSEKYKRDIYFGGVVKKKNYVSFYLMPVYINPKLLVGLSSDLKKRMQGKSCFNFIKFDEILFKELSILTSKGFEYYKKNGML
jgi:hypothetical protein